ncbi:MAG: cupin-like domain-containing protein, partial [Algoriella sp.]
FSVSLRSLAHKPKNLSEAVYNVFIMRTIDNIMRKIKGQYWIDKKNKLAIINTNKLIGL